MSFCVLYPTFLLTILLNYSHFDSIHPISCLFQEDKFPFKIKYEFLEIPFSCLPSNIVKNIILHIVLYEGDSWSCFRTNLYFSHHKALLPVNSIPTIIFIPRVFVAFLSLDSLLQFLPQVIHTCILQASPRLIFSLSFRISNLSKSR